MNRQYESMTRCTVGQFTVRVWATESTLPVVGMGCLRDDIKYLMHAVNTEFFDKEGYMNLTARISAALDTLPGIAAYEILDTDGNGALVYPDWK